MVRYIIKMIQATVTGIIMNVSCKNFLIFEQLKRILLSFYYILQKTHTHKNNHWFWNLALGQTLEDMQTSQSLDEDWHGNKRSFTNSLFLKILLLEDNYRYQAFAPVVASRIYSSLG